MVTTRQLSFAAGEIAPSLYGRIDNVKYATGLRTCRNFLVARHGGAFNRPGTQFVAEVNDSSKQVRLVPFIFNVEQTFILEFGNLYMRVIKAGAQVRETATTITGITQADPGVVTTSAPHGYSNGDEVFLSGVVGMTEVNNRSFKVSNVAATTFELQTMIPSVDVDTSGFGAYVSGGTAERPFTLVTPYLEAELPNLRFAQSGNIMTLVHPNHEVRNLVRVTDTSWTLTVDTFLPNIGRPTDLALVSSTGGGATVKYAVTAIRRDTFEQSLRGKETVTSTITGATQANPVVITTSAAHLLNSGDAVVIEGVGGMTEINDREFVIDKLTATTFELRDIDGTGFTAYTSGGTVNALFLTIGSVTFPAPGSAITISWTAVPNAREYNVYRSQNGIFGFIGVSGETTFVDDGFIPDTTDTPPEARNPFKLASDFPSTVTFYQGRKLFANTTNNPERVFASRSGFFSNFSFSQPSQADDSIIFTLAGRQVNRVEHLIDVGRLLAFTSGGEWAVNGDDAGILRPTAINAKQFSYHGSGNLAPIIVESNALYLQVRGNVIRSLGFDIQVDGYRGNDLTIFSPHLVDEFTLLDWTYQQIPNSIVWAVRSDGQLLGMTYIPEHQLVAWHRHDFQAGTVENVGVIPAGNEDALYVVVKRTLNSRTTRYIERMVSRKVDEDNVEDLAFMDSSLSFDGTNTTATTMTLSGGTTWNFPEILTLTASSAFFESGDVGNAIHITSPEGTLVKCEITAFTSTTVVSVRPNKLVPVSLRNVAVATWAEAVDQVGGLFHLEGQNVSVFGDGNVVASPNNDDYDIITVSGGIATLDRPYSVIHVGLPYTSDVETLDIDTAQGEPLVDQKKLITEVTLFVEDSRGIWVGPKPPADDTVDPLEGLRELKKRSSEAYDDPVDLSTEPENVKIDGEWNSNGRVFIRQVDPIPLGILQIAPAGLIPFR